MRIFLIALLASLAAPCFAQHLGARVQWQPETADTDTRLQQPVQIEILGRAAVPAMHMLSEKTGVSLSVAPEDLNTVGERKLTIISKGLSLKAIMVQLPEALQEAHWDMDASGEQPVYLLHRNAGVETAVQQERDRQRAAFQESWRQRGQECLDDVRRALAMSPDELAELEKTDIFIARAARYPPTRTLMEAYLSLPEEQLTQLVETRGLEFRYQEATPVLRAAVEAACEMHRRYAQWAQTALPDSENTDDWEAQLRHLEEQLRAGGDATIRIRVSPGGREYLGPVLSVQSESVSFGTMLVPARFSRTAFPGSEYEWLLVETGEAAEDARRIVENSSDEWLKLRDARQWDESGWVEPTDLRLHQPWLFSIEPQSLVRQSDMQQAIAAQIGLSLVSDYFTDGWISLQPSQPSLDGPIWRALYLLGLSSGYKWKAVGDCLLFHRTNWYELAQQELPEALLDDYLRRMEHQGHLTLDDVAELASVLATRPGAGRRGGFSLPSELDDARPATYPYSRWALLLWGALSPSERAAAESEQGLPFEELGYARTAAIAKAAWPVRGPFDDDQASEERIRGAVFRVARSEGTDELGAYTGYDLGIEYPDDSREPMTVSLVLHDRDPGLPPEP